MKFQPARRGLRTGVSAVAVAAVLSLSIMATGALAADTSTLQGRAAPGATVTATDTVTGQSVTTTASADGSYIIVGLRPSNYHVVAGANQDDIALAVGETGTLDLAEAAPADAQGAVVVRGRRTKEVRTSEIATSVSQRQIENLPQNDRNFMNFAALAPGVSVSTSTTQKQFQGGGVGPDQVNVFIDGQSFKNFSGHGGVSGQAFSRGNPFPQLAVQEFKVSSQNFKAEIEQAGSSVISAVTKSGGSEYHGTFFYQVQSKDMIGQPFFERANPKPDYNREQYGFDVGGPIIKDTLHFYLAYEGTKQQNPSTAVSVPSNAGPFTGSFADPFSQDLIFGKLTWYLSDADTLDFSVFKRDEEDIRDYGGNRARESARNIRSKTDQFSVEWTHRGDGWLNEMSLSYRDDATGTPQITESGPQITLTNGVFGPDAAILGRHFFAQDSTQKLTTFKDDFTFSDMEWHGRHTVKMGVKVAQTTLTRDEDVHTQGSYWVDISGNYAYTNLSAAATAGKVWKGQVALAPTGLVSADNTMYGLYIQDDWEVNDHLTLNLGLRWDYESNMMNNEYVTPTKIVDALKAYTNWTAAGIDYRDYVSTGSNRESFTGAFQPRVGFSYDVMGDRNLVLFGGWGRYYDRNAFIAASLETIVNTRQTPELVATLTPAQTDANTLRTQLAAAGTGGSVWLLNNETKVPYTDQANLGFRARFGDIQTTFGVAHNRSHDAFQYVRGNRMLNGTFSPMGDGYVIDNFPAEGQLAGFNGKLNIGANGGEAKYDSVYMTVDKPFSVQDGYGFSATLTLANAKNTGSEHGSDEFFAGARQDVFGYSYTLGVDKLRFVGTGIVAGPWDTTMSATLTLASGTPFGMIDGTGPNPPNACCIANLSGVYFPEDDLAYQNLDLRIAKDFELPNGHVVTVDGQVYNVFDHVNRAYSAWGAGSNWGGGPAMKENATVGQARSFQVGLKYKW
ncbi:hypothetical protein ABAC460_07575 [Asticcacaulis sp. AC460]|uniref:TonB-dependent receptor n=1 Tax=Asticcacaulis sp. AC460 TaxID=1282360 RepID=UPI0003C3CF96|nr:TonB-dependent receptor [Asticcacaulis sp. AC460]ESQ91082.1 hypothetical protein ABAC460_07575 [Asticcacaulis sp. AC460]